MLEVKGVSGRNHIVHCSSLSDSTCHDCHVASRKHHLNLILHLVLCVVLENVLISFFTMELSSFPSTTYERDYLFSIVYSYLLLSCKSTILQYRIKIKKKLIKYQKRKEKDACLNKWEDFQLDRLQS